MIVDRGDVVFYARDINASDCVSERCAKWNRTVKWWSFWRTLMNFYVTGSVNSFRLLDGEQSVSNVCYLATTNYLDRFPPRLLRPGRFDEHVYVPFPPTNGRVAYLKAKLGKKLQEADADATARTLAAKTSGMSFGHLRELVLAHYVLKQPLDTVIERLRKTASAELEGETPRVDTSKYGDDGPFPGKNLKRGYSEAVERLAPKAMAALVDGEPVDESKMEVVTDDPVLALELIAWMKDKGIVRVSTEPAGTLLATPETDDQLKARVQDALAAQGVEIPQPSLLTEDDTASLLPERVCAAFPR